MRLPVDSPSLEPAGAHRQGREDRTILGPVFSNKKDTSVGSNQTSYFSLRPLLYDPYFIATFKGEHLPPVLKDCCHRESDRLTRRYVYQILRIELCLIAVAFLGKHAFHCKGTFTGHNTEIVHMVTPWDRNESCELSLTAKLERFWLDSDMGWDYLQAGEIGVGQLFYGQHPGILVS